MSGALHDDRSGGGGDGGGDERAPHAGKGQRTARGICSRHPSITRVCFTFVSFLSLRVCTAPARCPRSLRLSRVTRRRWHCCPRLVRLVALRLHASSEHVASPHSSLLCVLHTAGRWGRIMDALVRSPCDRLQLRLAIVALLRLAKLLPSAALRLPRSAVCFARPSRAPPHDHFTLCSHLRYCCVWMCE